MRLRHCGRSGSAARALLSLVEEAARLQQLTRLAQLGRRPRAGRNRQERERRAEDDEEDGEEEVEADEGFVGSRLRLGDLLHTRLSTVR